MAERAARITRDTTLKQLILHKQLRIDFKARVLPYYRGVFGKGNQSSAFKALANGFKATVLLWRTIFLAVIASAPTLLWWLSGDAKGAAIYGLCAGGLFWVLELVEIQIMVYRAYVGIRFGRAGTPAASAVFFTPYSWTVPREWRSGLETTGHSVFVMGNLQHLFDIFFSLVQTTTLVLLSFYMIQCADGNTNQYASANDLACPEAGDFTPIFQTWVLFGYSTLLLVLGVGWAVIQPQAMATWPQIVATYTVFVVNVAFLSTLLGSVHSLMTDRAIKSAARQTKAGGFFMQRIREIAMPDPDNFDGGFDEIDAQTKILDLLEGRVSRLYYVTVGKNIEERSLVTWFDSTTGDFQDMLYETDGSDYYEGSVSSFVDEDILLESLSISGASRGESLSHRTTVFPQSTFSSRPGSFEMSELSETGSTSTTQARLRGFGPFSRRPFQQMRPK